VPDPRPALAQLHGYQALADADRAVRALGAPELRAKLDSNEGQFGPLPAALEAIERHAPLLNRYPDRPLVLAERLSQRHAVDPTAILIGNGADAIVGYLCTAYLEPGDEAVMGWPSFVTYHGDSLRSGAKPVTVGLRDGAYDLEVMLERIGPRTKLAFVCNPNNPTGGFVSGDRLRRFLDEVPERVLVVIDEAYNEYVRDDSYPDAIAEHVRDRGNVAVVRTFSKIFGLAGLRVGYMVAPPDVVEAAGRCRHWFDVSDLAHLAAAASLDDEHEIARRRRENESGREQLSKVLEFAGLRPMPSQGNFLYADVPSAAALSGDLARRGVLVRSLEAFGATSAIRVTVGSGRDHEALADALRQATG
jgi:histidinol-phosphate aminotransferase